MGNLRLSSLHWTSRHTCRKTGLERDPPKAALFPSVYLEDICSVELIMNVGEKVGRGKGEVQKRMLSV